MTHSFHTAGSTHALQELGMEKDAFLGFLGRGLGWLGTNATNALAAPINAVGRGFVNFLGRRGVSPTVTDWMTRMGQNVGRDAAIGGLFNVGLNAAMGEEGHRFDNLGRNFATGAIGGGLFRGGMNAAKGLGSRVVGAPRWQAWDSAPWSGGTLGDKAKWLGTGAVGMAGGLGAGALAPDFSAQQQQQPGYQPVGPQLYNQMQPKQNWNR